MCYSCSYSPEQYYWKITSKSVASSADNKFNIKIILFLHCDIFRTKYDKMLSSYGTEHMSILFKK